MPFPDEDDPVTLILDFDRWSTDFSYLLHTLQVRELGVVNHVGSTSVPGLVAKDVIDAQIRVPIIQTHQTKNAFASIGFRHP